MIELYKVLIMSYVSNNLLLKQFYQVRKRSLLFLLYAFFRANFCSLVASKSSRMNRLMYRWSNYSPLFTLSGVRHGVSLKNDACSTSGKFVFLGPYCKTLFNDIGFLIKHHYQRLQLNVCKGPFALRSI